MNVIFYPTALQSSITTGMLLYLTLFDWLYIILNKHWKGLIHNCSTLCAYLSTAQLSPHSFSLCTGPCFQKYYIIVPNTISALCNLLSSRQVKVPVVDSSTIHFYFSSSWSRTFDKRPQCDQTEPTGLHLYIFLCLSALSWFLYPFYLSLRIWSLPAPVEGKLETRLCVCVCVCASVCLCTYEFSLQLSNACIFATTTRWYVPLNADKKEANYKLAWCQGQKLPAFTGISRSHSNALSWFLYACSHSHGEVTVG